MTTTPIPTGVKYVKDGDIHVDTVWTGVPLDRPNTGGWLIGGNDARKNKLADRLVRAINAGAVHTNVTIATDIYGQTYVTANRNILGRMMNADLNRLGF